MSQALMVGIVAVMIILLAARIFQVIFFSAPSKKPAALPLMKKKRGKK